MSYPDMLPVPVEMQYPVHGRLPNSPTRRSNKAERRRQRRMDKMPFVFSTKLPTLHGARSQTRPVAVYPWDEDAHASGRKTGNHTTPQRLSLPLIHDRSSTSLRGRDERAPSPLSTSALKSPLSIALPPERTCSVGPTRFDKDARQLKMYTEAATTVLQAPGLSLLQLPPCRNSL